MELRELPQSCNCPSHQLPSVQSLCVGFGYDPKLNDYKVVQFWLLGGNAGDDSINRIEVYTLSTDSWKGLNNTNHLGARIVNLQNLECLYFNGACYWIAFGYFDGRKAFILSFDMSDEVFRNIRFPSFYSNTGEEPLNFSMLTACHLGIWKLMVFNDFLFCDANANTFEIWVVDGCDSNGTWKKHLKDWTGTKSRPAWPLLFWKNDKFISEDKDRMVCCYNICTQDIIDLPLQRHVQQYSGTS